VLPKGQPALVFLSKREVAATGWSITDAFEFRIEIGQKSVHYLLPHNAPVRGRDSVPLSTGWLERCLLSDFLGLSDVLWMPELHSTIWKLSKDAIECGFIYVLP
jgi:hypothetical protein